MLGYICFFNDPATTECDTYRHTPSRHDALPIYKRGWRAAELSSANGQGTASALARVYGALASDGKIDGKALVKPDTIKKMTAVQIEGHDEVLAMRSEEHTSELQSLMRISYAVFCLKKNTKKNNKRQ